MIYKRTYQFYIVLLLTGMGLMLLKENFQYNQQDSKNQSTKEILKQSNRILSISSNKVTNDVKEQVKKKKEYKGLIPPMEQVEELVDDFMYNMEKRENKLRNAQQSSIRTRAEIVGETYRSINQDVEQLRTRILTLLDQLKKKYRNLGIKSAELKVIEEMYLIDITEGIYLNELKSIYNLQTTNLELEKLRNKVLIIQSAVINYLGSKIGATTVCSTSRFAVIAQANSSVVEPNEPYEAWFDLAEISFRQRPFAVSVDGVPLKGEDGHFKYVNKSIVSGKQQYKVEMKFKNQFTGKTNTFRKTFNYYVK